jgi:hypothetical protein
MQSRQDGAKFASQTPAGYLDWACDFYFLLCMFNGFAFGRPLCREIKVMLVGVG